MRPPRIRFTFRGIMVLTAIVAVIAAQPALHRRSLDFRKRAFSHRLTRDQVTFSAAERATGPVGAAELAALNRRLAAYHESIIWRYEWAARFPCLPILFDQADPVTGGLDRGFTWVNVYFRLASPHLVNQPRGIRRWGPAYPTPEQVRKRQPLL